MGALDGPTTCFKEEKEKQIRSERRCGVEGCPSDCECDFSGDLAFKDAFLCKVNKFVDIEEIKSNLTKRSIALYPAKESLW